VEYTESGDVAQAGRSKTNRTKMHLTSLITAHSNSNRVLYIMGRNELGVLQWSCVRIRRFEIEKPCKRSSINIYSRNWRLGLNGSLMNFTGRFFGYEDGNGMA
jgi:hypothetical protein